MAKRLNRRIKRYITRFFRKTTKVEVLGMLKKTQAAREFRIRATTKRMLYRQENTVANNLASITQLTEALETMPLIFWRTGEGAQQAEGDISQRENTAAFLY